MINSYTTAADFQQTRDFGQKISAVFDFLRLHFRPLFRCLVQYALLVPLAGFIAAGVAQKLFFPGYQPTGLSTVFMVGMAPAVLLSYIPLLLGYALLILTVYGYVNERMATPAAQEVPSAQVGAFVRAHFLRTFGSLIGLGVVLMLAFMLLFVPGVWLGVPASLFFIVQLRENRSFGDTLTRCVALVKGHWWATLGLLIVISFIQAVLPLLVQVVGGILLGVGATLTGGSEGLDLPLLTYGWVAVSNLLSLVMYTLVLLAIAFQYFNLVELKEGRGVYALLDELGRPAPVGQPTGQRYRADEEGEY
ncbi:MAG: hypothetical protein H7330_13280 [Hymenobacteraceae bacterium]|nr:hypothetical protein [Hymenobacteraceae bacterium]